MRRLSITSVLLFILFVLLACQPTAAAQPTSTPLSTDTQVPIESSSTSTPQRLPTRIPTATFLPPLTVEEMEILINELMLSENKCDLPCWWKLTPGETTTEEIQAFLEPFLGVERLSEFRYEFYRYEGFVDPFPLPNGFDFSVAYFGNKNVTSLIIVRTNMVAITEDGYETLPRDPRYLDLMKDYAIAEIFKKYGRPTEVFIRSIYPARFPSQISLYYPEKGFLVEYFIEAHNLANEDRLIICPVKNNIKIKIRVFDPGLDLRLRQIFEFGDNSTKHKALFEATDTNLEIFFETFGIPDSPKCFTTPGEIWPSAYDNWD